MTQEYRKPLPGVDAVTEPFWNACKQHELKMQKCLQCGEFIYPASPMCPHCQSFESEWVKLSGKGSVYSYIIVRRATNPAFAEEVPYTVAIIETEEGPRITSNVIGIKPEDVRVDMPVEVVFEDVTPEVSLHKFKPVA
ncbi:MAG: Zn-ribbon domain-containing OB-fold protein [Dehalococcoidales bacterium]